MNAMNAQNPVVDSDSRCEVRAAGVLSEYDGGTTKRAPDRVLGGPQSRALDGYEGAAQ